MYIPFRLDDLPRNWPKTMSAGLEIVRCKRCSSKRGKMLLEVTLIQCWVLLNNSIIVNKMVYNDDSFFYFGNRGLGAKNVKIAYCTLSFFAVPP